MTWPGRVKENVFGFQGERLVLEIKKAFIWYQLLDISEALDFPRSPTHFLEG